MNASMNDPEFDQGLHEALGRPRAADFETWRRRHGDAIGHLNPVVTRIRRRNQRAVALASKALVLLLVVAAVATWFAGSDRVSLAQVAQRIDRARTISWTSTGYERWTSADGQRTWISTTRCEQAYRSPGLYRQTYFDAAGKIQRIVVNDSNTGRTLTLDPRNHRATLSTRHFNSPQGPFASTSTTLKDESLEFVGKRQTQAGPVSVVRVHAGNRRGAMNSADYWIDPGSKQLVGLMVPGADEFDPEALPDRDNPAEEKPSSGTNLGSVLHNIVFDAKLEADLFSLEAPADYSVAEQPTPAFSEAELVDWLEALARFNDSRFPDDLGSKEFDRDRLNAVARKPKAEQVEAERRLIELNEKFMLARVRPPVAFFIRNNTVPDSFRYLGRGVPLGSPNRLVCWYRLKSNGALRAIYGDLTVKDVQPEDLPLRVE